MLKQNEFDRFYEASWKFQAVDMIIKKLRGNISRIWDGIPPLLKNISGQESFTTLFAPLYKKINESGKDLDKCSREFSKLFKEVIHKLQKYGVFINNPFSVDTLALKVKQGNVVTETVESIFEDVKNQFNLKPTDIDITKPNVAEIYIITKAKINATITFLEGSRKVLNGILSSANTVKVGSEFSVEESVKNTIEQTNKSFDVFVEALKQLEQKIIDEEANLGKVLEDVNISFSLSDERKEEITQQVKYCEIYDTYREVLMMMKPNAAFNKLMGNRTDDKSVYEKVETVQPVEAKVLIENK